MNHKLQLLLAAAAFLLISTFSSAEERPVKFQNSNYRVEFSNSYRNTFGFYGLRLGGYFLSGAWDLQLVGHVSPAGKRYSLKKTNEYQAVQEGENLLLNASRELTENGEDGEVLAKVEQKLLFTPEKVTVSFLIVPEQDIPINRGVRYFFRVYNGGSMREFLGKTVEATLSDNTVKSFVVKREEKEEIDRKAWYRRDLFTQVCVVGQNDRLFFIAEDGNRIWISHYGTGIEFWAVLPSNSPDFRPTSLQKGQQYLLSYSIQLQP